MIPETPSYASVYTSYYRLTLLRIAHYCIGASPVLIVTTQPVYALCARSIKGQWTHFLASVAGSMVCYIVFKPQE
eukprot:scaffold504581_cov17-Prasinocladus_malaysianus.AAC.1